MPSFDANRPYNELPWLPPTADIESKAILKKCIDARAALATLRESAKRIPSQAVLINTIPLLEAQASSEIENIVTTTDLMFKYAADGAEVHADPATKEALRYRTALYEGFTSLQTKPLCTATAVQVCETIKGKQMQVRRVPGIALANDATQRVVYTPPEGEDRIRTLLGNWEKFIHERLDIDPLIRMAVMHYQFEAIHPFTDGNGRTGRVLNLVFLVEQDLLDLPILYLSRHIIKNKSEYYRLLLSVTTGANWEEWIMYMLDAIESTARWTTQKIEAMKTLMDESLETLREKLPASYNRDLIDVLFARPYCRITNVIDAKIAQRQTASRILKELIDIGLLVEKKVGRQKLFINIGLMALLTQR